MIDTLNGRIFEASDLALDEKLEGSLRNEKSISRTSGVPNGKANLHGGQTFQRINAHQFRDKDFVEDVVDTSTARKFSDYSSFILTDLTFNRFLVSMVEFVNKIQNKRLLQIFNDSKRTSKDKRRRI